MLARNPEDNIFAIMPFAVIGLRKAKFDKIFVLPLFPEEKEHCQVSPAFIRGPFTQQVANDSLL